MVGVLEAVVKGSGTLFSTLSLMRTKVRTVKNLQLVTNQYTVYSKVYFVVQVYAWQYQKWYQPAGLVLTGTFGWNWQD